MVRKILSQELIPVFSLTPVPSAAVATHFSFCKDRSHGTENGHISLAFTLMDCTHRVRLTGRQTGEKIPRSCLYGQ